VEGASPGSPWSRFVIAATLPIAGLSGGLTMAG
jgi:hypothetical protein